METVTHITNHPQIAPNAVGHEILDLAKRGKLVDAVKAAVGLDLSASTKDAFFEYLLSENLIFTAVLILSINPSTEIIDKIAEELIEKGYFQLALNTLRQGGSDKLFHRLIGIHYELGDIHHVEIVLRTFCKAKRKPIFKDGQFERL